MYRGVRRVAGVYDMACGFGQKVVARFQEKFPHLVEELKKVIGIIPKMHLVNHKDWCRQNLSFHYTEGVGRTDGEAVERGWAISNEDARSTREMTNGHRHDTLNDQNNATNFTKSVKLGEYITFTGVIYPI